METQQYRKKPVVIQAVQLSTENAEEVATWCSGQMWQDSMLFPIEDRITHVIINTLKGDHQANPGDWIIKGVAGEFYPCKDAIFQQTYQLASENPIGVADVMRAVGWTEGMIGAAMDARYSADG